METKKEEEAWSEGRGMIASGQAQREDGEGEGKPSLYYHTHRGNINKAAEQEWVGPVEAVNVLVLPMNEEDEEQEE